MTQEMDESESKRWSVGAHDKVFGLLNQHQNQIGAIQDVVQGKKEFVPVLCGWSPTVVHQIGPKG